MVHDLPENKEKDINRGLSSERNSYMFQNAKVCNEKVCPRPMVPSKGK